MLALLPFKRLAFILSATLLAASALCASAAHVSFDFEPLYTVWGGTAGNSPGDGVMVEDGVPVYVERFHLGGFVGFHEAMIDLPIAGFGSVQTLRLNNISVIFDFGGVPGSPSDAYFGYADLGGDENIQVNGSTLYEIPEMMALDGVMVAPGVTMHVSAAAIPGGHAGVVWLEGPVDKLRVGGQEFWIDDVRTLEEEQPCDFLVDFESQPIGAFWGSTAGNMPGDLIFVEDSIPVGVTEFTLGAYTGFNEARIVGAGDCLVSHSCWTNNIDLWFDIQAAAPHTSKVIFEYQDYGGDENLEVNGAPRYEGDLASAPYNIAPDVTCTVTTWPGGGGGICGRVVLEGDVHRLVVGGQEFELDNICVITGSTDVGEAPDAASTNRLAAPYPNPFNPKTELSYSLDAEGPVRLSIHDVLGREIAVLVDSHQASGSHRVSWDGRDARGKSASSGVYFAKLRALGRESSRKLVLSK